MCVSLPRALKMPQLKMSLWIQRRSFWILVPVSLSLICSLLPPYRWQENRPAPFLFFPSEVGRAASISSS